MSENLNEKRLEICKQCEFYNSYLKLCKQCGCFMPVKVKIPNIKCPVNKW